MRSLVLESKEFDLLLGKRLPQGGYVSGLAAQYLSEHEIKLITLRAGEESARAGKNAEAVQLFDLAEARCMILMSRCRSHSRLSVPLQAHEDAVQLLVRLLGQHLTDRSPERAEVLQLAGRVFDSYRSTLLNEWGRVCPNAVCLYRPRRAAAAEQARQRCVL